ncbi:hypothetical protein UCDDA912_g04323 [Diaporthe ampelina]|uniref:Uncharacterized protein n=1 Tax=Diaporthe ampelina TaxID=1214573 RepID=A0A0G2I7A7_9PEZI|nr:hypothetical protein UCDDA912_g04323 [Diaporthe ampelina]
MHIAIRTASRLPRPWIGQASTTAQLTAVRHSSNITPDEFVKQSVGTQHGRLNQNDGTKNPSSLVIKKVQAKDLPWRTAMEKRVAPRSLKIPPIKGVELAPSSLVRSHKIRDTRYTKPWKLPAKTWQEKPLKVFSRPSALNLHRLPLAATIKDILLSIDNAVQEQKADKRSIHVSEIVIIPRSDSSEGVDAAVKFLHPSGARILRDLAAEGKLKVQGVVPEVSLSHFQDPSEIPQPSEDVGDVEIAQLSEQDRAEYFTAPELRKIARRTSLIYN